MKKYESVAFLALAFSSLVPLSSFSSYSFNPGLESEIKSDIAGHYTALKKLDSFEKHYEILSDGVKDLAAAFDLHVEVYQRGAKTVLETNTQRRIDVVYRLDVMLESETNYKDGFLNAFKYVQPTYLDKLAFSLKYNFLEPKDNTTIHDTVFGDFDLPSDSEIADKVYPTMKDINGNKIYPYKVLAVNPTLFDDPVSNNLPSNTLDEYYPSYGYDSVDAATAGMRVAENLTAFVTDQRPVSSSYTEGELALNIIYPRFTAGPVKGGKDYFFSIYGGFKIANYEEYPQSLTFTFAPTVSYGADKALGYDTERQSYTYSLKTVGD